MDENYYRPSKEQLNKIVPKIESETITDINLDCYVSADLTETGIEALEKRITELERKIKEYETGGGLFQKSP